MPSEYQMQVKCPNCKAIGANVLVLSTTFLHDKRGRPCIECTKCQAFFALGDLCGSPMDFYAMIPILITGNDR